MSAETVQEKPDESEAPTVEELAEEVREVKSEAESAMKLAREQGRKILELRQREKEKDERIDELETELEEARSEIQSLRERTGLLQTVKNGSSMKIDERAAVMVQTLYNEAWQKQQSNANNQPKASMDYNEATKALGGSPDRSAIYRAMKKAEELVGDTAVCRKVKEGRSSDKNTRLVIDLDGGELPDVVAGQSITAPQEVRT